MYGDELRADRGALNRITTATAVACVGVVLVGVARQGTVAPAALWSIVGAGVLIAVGALSRTVISVHDVGGGFVLRRYRGTSVVRRADVHAAVFVTVYERAFAVPGALLLLLDNKGKPLVRLTGLTFSAEDLSRLAASSGDSVTRLDFADPAEVSRHAPKALGFTERHPVAYVVLATFGLLIAIVIGVAIFA